MKIFIVQEFDYSGYSEPNGAFTTFEAARASAEKNGAYIFEVSLDEEGNARRLLLDGEEF
jgi:hypothetical protein